MPKNVNSMTFQKQSKQGKIHFSISSDILKLKWHTEVYSFGYLHCCRVWKYQLVQFGILEDSKGRNVVRDISFTLKITNGSVIRAKYQMKSLYVDLIVRTIETEIREHSNFRTLFRIQDELLAICCNWGRVSEILGVEFWRGVFDFIFDGISLKVLNPTI